jgi:hypothetical protein
MVTYDVAQVCKTLKADGMERVSLAEHGVENLHGSATEGQGGRRVSHLRV